jgi:hypothetical protein
MNSATVNTKEEQAAVFAILDGALPELTAISGSPPEVYEIFINGVYFPVYTFLDSPKTCRAAVVRCFRARLWHLWVARSRAAQLPDSTPGYHLWRKHLNNFVRKLEKEGIVEYRLTERSQMTKGLIS